MLDAISVDEVTYDVSVVIDSESCCEGGAGHIERHRRSAGVEETMPLSRPINEETDDLPGSVDPESVALPAARHINRRVLRTVKQKSMLARRVSKEPHDLSGIVDPGGCSL